MAILLIGFLTAGVLAGFARTGAEMQIVDNQSTETAAFALAEAGLADYMARGSINPLSATYTYPGGQAVVTATLVRDGAAATDPDTYLVRSVGRPTGAPNKPQATRTVAQLGEFRIGTMNVVSSWTSLNTLNKSGASGSLSGWDACGGTPVAGVSTPVGGFTGYASPVTGSPQFGTLGSTLDEYKQNVKIDWAAIANPVSPAIVPDHIVCKSGTYGYEAGYSPCTSWPASFADPNYWPVILVNGSLKPALPTNGRGTLIVTGDLDIGGNQFWDGIILVGGAIHDKGNGGITGAVVSGLNVLKGMTVGMSIVDDASGTKIYQFNSCTVAQALSNQSRLRPITNAWVDNWRSW